MKKEKEKQKQRGINPYLLLGAFVIIAAIASYIIPAGTFQREEAEGVSQPVVVAGTYERIEAHHAGVTELVGLLNTGMVAAASIIFLVFASTGAFMIFQKTGAFENGIGTMIKYIKRARIPDSIVLLLMVILFSFLGYVSGPDALIPFTLVACMIAVGLGFDLLVGLALVLAGAGIGFSFSAMNAAVVAVPQAIVGLPIFSAAGFRTIMWAVGTLVVAAVIILYARRVRKDPSKSLAPATKESPFALEKEIEDYTLDGRQRIIVVLFVAMFVTALTGALTMGWYLNEIGGVFILFSLVAGVVGGNRLSDVINWFIEGASATAAVAVLIGLARSIQVLFENAQVLDTIVHAVASPLSALPPSIAALLITVMTAVVHIVIPSGSGLSVAMMPILGPVGTLVGLTSQTTVLAFQVGGSVFNMITPTVGSTMAMCGIAGVPFSRWFKVGAIISVAALLVAWVFILIAVAIGL